MEKQVRVGVSCFICLRDTVLVGKRRGSHGAGLYSVVGGHQEFGESVYEAGVREIREECGDDLKVHYVRTGLPLDLMSFLPEKQYVDIPLFFYYLSGTPYVMEPDKCGGWMWMSRTEILSRDDIFPGVKERLWL